MNVWTLNMKFKIYFYCILCRNYLGFLCNWIFCRICNIIPQEPFFQFSLHDGRTFLILWLTKMRIVGMLKGPQEHPLSIILAIRCHGIWCNKKSLQTWLESSNSSDNIWISIMKFKKLNLRKTNWILPNNYSTKLFLIKKRNFYQKNPLRPLVDQKGFKILLVIWLDFPPHFTFSFALLYRAICLSATYFHHYMYTYSNFLFSFVFFFCLRREFMQPNFGFHGFFLQIKVFFSFFLSKTWNVDFIIVVPMYCFIDIFSLH